MTYSLQARRGFVVVDVMTALAMLAATLSFCLLALTTALFVEKAAREQRSAQTLLRDLAERSYAQLGVFNGVSGDISWQADLQKVASNSSLVDCRLTLAATAERRSYGLSTIQACPLDTGE